MTALIDSAVPGDLVKWEENRNYSREVVTLKGGAVYSIGAVLGLSPVTHRALIASITPVAIPSANAQQLDPRVIRRIQSGAFNVFQLDATAYPGNSGSPLYDIESGEVRGIINMVFVKGTKESALSQPTGISFAIPSRFLQALVDQAATGTPAK